MIVEILTCEGSELRMYESVDKLNYRTNGYLKLIRYNGESTIISSGLINFNVFTEDGKEIKKVIHKKNE